MTNACNQQTGNTCDRKDAWKMNAKGSHITQPNFLSSRPMFGNPSGPLEFLDFSAFRTRSTLNGVKLTSEHLLLNVARRGKSGMFAIIQRKYGSKISIKGVGLQSLINYKIS